MTLQELSQLKGSPELPFAIRSKSKKWNKLSINHSIAIPIEKVALYYKTNSDISIYSSLGLEVGMLCFTKELGTIFWRELTENQFIAFLTEAQISDKDSAYKFSYNYAIIKEDFYLEYMNNFKDSAALWGGFYHTNSGINTSNYTKSVTSIHLAESKFKTPLFAENLVRAIAQPFAFERFLKLYHLLELRFDYDVIEKIQGLDVTTDSKLIGEILNNYSTKEILRLTDILMNYCTNIPAIVDKLNEIRNFQVVALDIFSKFGGKESNPFNKEEIRLTQLLQTGFEERHLSAAGINFQANYRNFILKLAAFWIYRVRCSIAHNKIGEYILSMDQEGFIVEFAEPLLKEVLTQCFKQ